MGTQSAHAFDPASEPEGTPSPDSIEATLAEALRLAAQSGQWTTVEVLSRELGARRSASTAAPDVHQLVDAREKDGNSA